MALFEQLIKIYEDSNGFFNSIDFFYYGKKSIDELTSLIKIQDLTPNSQPFLLLWLWLCWYGLVRLDSGLGSLSLCCLLTCASWRMMMCLHLNVEDQYSGAGSGQSRYFWIGSGLRPYFGLSLVLGQMNLVWIQFRSKKKFLSYLSSQKLGSCHGSGLDPTQSYNIA